MAPANPPTEKGDVEDIVFVQSYVKETCFSMSLQESNTSPRCQDTVMQKHSSECH